MSHVGLEPPSDCVGLEPETLSSGSLENIPVENSFQPITSSRINGRMSESCNAKEHGHDASGMKDSRSPSPLSESCDRKRRKSLIFYLFVKCKANRTMMYEFDKFLMSRITTGLLLFILDALQLNSALIH